MLPAGRFIEFGPFRVDAEKGVLLRDGALVPLAPKAFETLLRLLREPGQVVTKGELMDAVWPDTIVEENNLTQSVSALRKALGDDGSTYITTIAKRGYQFVGGLREPGDAVPGFLAAPGAPGRGARRAWLPWSVTALGAAAAILVGARIASKPAAPMLARSIAVLPFKSLAGEARDEVLELGMADVLITRLSGLKEFAVRPIGAVRRYTSLDEDPIAAGRALKVDAVLEGTIHRRNDRLRFTARLLSVSDGRSTWTGEFDEKGTDLFTVEDSIASKMAEALVPDLSKASRGRLAVSPTRDAVAYQEYLKGRYFWNKRTADGIGKAIEHFRRALDVDPNDTLAWAGLADCYITRYDWQFQPATQAVPEAKAALTRALALDPLLAETHASRAYLAFLYDRDGPTAEQEFGTALRLQPNYATAHQWYGRYLSSLGRFEEAVQELKKAQELDPLSLVIGTNLGAIHYYARAYDRAIEEFEKTLEMGPDFALAHWQLADACERKGAHERAIAEYLRAMALSGQREDADRLEKEIKGLAFPASFGTLVRFWGSEDRLPVPAASRCAVAGDREQALKWLERAVREHNPWIAFLKVNPQLDSLRSEPRFQDILVRSGFPP